MTSMGRRFLALAVGTLVVPAILTPVCAAPMVTFSARAEGIGFRYNFTVDNTGPGFIVIGLDVLQGSSVFQLDASSDISVPTVGGVPWGFLAPIPAFADTLAYFSFEDKSDIQEGKKQGGFSFVSPTNVADLKGKKVAVVLIVKTGPPINTQIELPEPASAMLCALGLGCLAVAVFRARPRDHKEE